MINAFVQKPMCMGFDIKKKIGQILIFDHVNGHERKFEKLFEKHGGGPRGEAP